MRELQRAYVSLYALVQRVGAREGAALLLLLLANTYKAMNYIYVATSAYYAHGTEIIITNTLYFESVIAYY